MSEWNEEKVPAEELAAEIQRRVDEALKRIDMDEINQRVAEEVEARVERAMQKAERAAERARSRAERKAERAAERAQSRAEKRARRARTWRREKAGFYEPPGQKERQHVLKMVGEGKITAEEAEKLFRAMGL